MRKTEHKMKSEYSKKSRMHLFLKRSLLAGLLLTGMTAVTIFVSDTLTTPDSLSISDLIQTIKKLPSFNSFDYINPGVLTEHYFEKAEESLEDSYIYLVLSRTNSASSKIIGTFTGDRYNHISISFDYDLSTVISYNGGNNRFPPGMNPEELEDLNQGEGAQLLVYRHRVSREEKLNMINFIRKINQEGSAYNLLGLILKKSVKPNIMFCSQFVYSLLKENGIQYFAMNPLSVKPEDFIKRDYKRDLQFCYDVRL